MSTFSSAPLWYTTRSTGIIAFVLLTAVMVLGVASTQRALAGPRWPRFATQALHRNLSLLAVVMLAVHIVTTIVDSFVNVGWLSALVPFTSAYKPLGVTLGTLTLDLSLVLVVTSLLRTRMSDVVWRGVHLAAYATWPLALAHFLMTGTDAAHGRWGLWLGLLAIVPVAGAVVVRLRPQPASTGPVRSAAGSSR